MATQVATARPLLPLPSDHLEQLSRAASLLTVDPLRDTLYYFFPLIGAYLNDYRELRSDPSQGAMMPPRATDQILAEVKNLTRCARIRRKIHTYIGLKTQFACCGGIYSLATPALFIPDQHLFRRDGNSAFAQGGQGANLQDPLWTYSDDQTRFLIARELGQIKENSILVRIAIKIAAVAAIFIIYASPFGWTLGLALAVSAIGLYILSERKFQARADTLGIEILGRRLHNPRRAAEIAIETLNKQMRQNIYRREHTALGRFYITQSGNNVLDLLHPYLTTRRSQCERKL
ncbi:MAG TPA: M48 family metalloprotease [Chlamydiales bacterium]|nr:M48 family metalloprotease [Chlamydiales bacterium]